jgi:hypothetical protein
MRLNISDIFFNAKFQRKYKFFGGGSRHPQASAPREEPDAEEREQAGQQSSGAHRQASASGQARPAAQPAQGAAPSAQLLAW